MRSQRLFLGSLLVSGTLIFSTGIGSVKFISAVELLTNDEAVVVVDKLLEYIDQPKVVNNKSPPNIPKVRLSQFTINVFNVQSKRFQ